MRIEKEYFVSREKAEQHQNWRNQWEDRYGRGIFPCKLLDENDKEIDGFRSEVEVY